MPEVSVRRLVEEDFLTAALGEIVKEIRPNNPLLFDFVIKRHVVAEGTRFAASVFETAAFFRTEKTKPML